jgi:hypothetical protein
MWIDEQQKVWVKAHGETTVNLCGIFYTFKNSLCYGIYVTFIPRELFKMK